MRKFVLLFLACVVVWMAFAHEYILSAYKYRLQKGDTLEVHLFVADGFNVQLERPFQKAPTKSFELLTTAGKVDLSGTTDGALPVINRKADFDGGGLIHLERDYARIRLSTPKFLDYLKEDHIEDIAAGVDKTKKEQRERYTRSVKCLVQSGAVYNDTLYKTITGQPFEIVLLQHPYRLRTGNTIRAKILFQGKPLVNKVITARNRTGSEPALAQTSRTDAGGICTFRLTRKGEWFIHATHMIPCPDKADSDWESFWTSYSFAVD